MSVPRSEAVTRSAVDVLHGLGYPVRLMEVDPRCWSSSGIDLSLPPTSSIMHACRVEETDWYMIRAEGDEARAAAGAFLQSCSSRNAVRKTVIIYCYQNSPLFSIYATVHGRVRRLDVDPDHLPHDVDDRLRMLQLPNESSLGVGEALERALDREAVTRHFFARFRASVESFRSELASAFPGEKPEAVADEALLLLSRILFLYFLQRKGWLDGDHRFLIDRFRRADARGERYFDRVLMPLFFGCLNTPFSSRTAEAMALGRIPYLNGGLFEPSLFEQSHPAIEISNELVEEVLVGTFERFSFTVDESDEEGVEIDPEMLGRVFESLMADDERLASGSYYTPRVIVDELVRRSVVRALAKGDGATTERIARVADGREAAGREEATALLARLRELTILDPACGSGAFLLASLKFVESLAGRLMATLGELPPASLRQQIVEHSLFGVDVKSQAVRLCELRLWLAIVAGRKCAVEEVPPLPNLDRNILQGNSLLSPLDFLGGRRREIYHAWSYALRARSDLVAAYRHATPDRKPALAAALRRSDLDIAAGLLDKAIESDESERAELMRGEATLFGRSEAAKNAGAIETLSARIADVRAARARVGRGELDFFAFDVHFAAALASGGFDLVVGNPPWVRKCRIDPHMRRLLSDRYRFFRASGKGGFDQSDLSVAFFERALALTAAGGVTALLMPAKLLTSGYAGRLRRELASSFSIAALLDWSSAARRYFQADTFPLGVVVEKGRGTGQIEVHAASLSFSMPQRRLAARGDAPWCIVPAPIDAIIARLTDRFPALGDALRRSPLMGVKTGDNRLFFLDVTFDRRGRAIGPGGVAIPREALVRAVRGRDVRRWSSSDSTWMLWPPIDGSRPPSWLLDLAAALEREATRFRLAYVRPEHLGIKVGWKDVGRGLQAVVLPETSSIGGFDFPVVPNQTVYSIDAADYEEAYFLAAVLNSTVVNALAVVVADRAKDFHYRYLAPVVRSLPFPQYERGGKAWKEIVRLSRRAHAGAEVDGEVDAAVARLYGVSAGEHRHLERHLRQRLGGAE